MKSVEVYNVKKKYGEILALNDVTFSVEKGEIFGLIGPDGAGKTTLFRLMATLLNPDDGSIKIEGYDVMHDYHEIRKILGYMPGRFSLYQDLSIEENLKFYAALFNMDLKDGYELIEPIYKQIAPFKKRAAGKLSGGMKQKLALCCALIHHPHVLLLDEPTTGVDAVSRSEFWDMLYDLKKKNITILVSTPYMDEASRCDRVALCNEGEILTIDSPNNITEKFDKTIYAVSADDKYNLLKETRLQSNILDCYPFGSSHHIIVDENFSEDIFKEKMMLLNLKNFNIEKIKPSIEDVFINLMKHE